MTRLSSLVGGRGSTEVGGFDMGTETFLVDLK